MLTTSNSPALVSGSIKNNSIIQRKEQTVKLKILNKKGFDAKNLKYDQVFVKGKPCKAGDVVEFDPKKEIDQANELVFNGWAAPDDTEAKKLYPKYQEPGYSEKAVETPDLKK